MSRRPPSPSGVPRWGVGVIVAGALAFGSLLPVALTRGAPGGQSTLQAQVGPAAPPSSAAPNAPADPATTAAATSAESTKAAAPSSRKREIASTATRLLEAVSTLTVL